MSNTPIYIDGPVRMANDYDNDASVPKCNSRILYAVLSRSFWHTMHAGLAYLTLSHVRRWCVVYGVWCMVCAYAITTSNAANTDPFEPSQMEELAYCLLLCAAQARTSTYPAGENGWLGGNCFAMLMLLVDFSFGFQSLRWPVEWTIGSHPRAGFQVMLAKSIAKNFKYTLPPRVPQCISPKTKTILLRLKCKLKKNFKYYYY